MNTLVAAGTGAAFVYSLIATFAPSVFIAHGVAPDLYYESVIIIIALVLTGNAMEARAKRRTSGALRALAELQPATARVTRGDAEVDESMLTGESMPVTKEVGDRGQRARANRAAHARRGRRNVRRAGGDDVHAQPVSRARYTQPASRYQASVERTPSRSETLGA